METTMEETMFRGCRESVYLVLNRRIFVDLTRKLANVIQQEELMFGIFIESVITKDEDCIRSMANMLAICIM
ncbi:unnamed protein product [Arabis nemorensis]|uniref:Uncharacterized protein n=1 Tax=Arabis nemorensis TaxID=586526 RepID=A0A565AYM8_9BRAS|nr:unnamed protein product [Arabis nemorensis]